MARLAWAAKDNLKDCLLQLIKAKLKVQYFSLDLFSKIVRMWIISDKSAFFNILAGRAFLQRSSTCLACAFLAELSLCKILLSEHSETNTNKGTPKK